MLCCIVFIGSTSVGFYRWPMLARQRVTLPQISVQPRLKFDFISSGKFHSGGIGYRGRKIKLKTIISVCATNAFVVADDKTYRNKQIISITPQLYDYILESVREPEVTQLELLIFVLVFDTNTFIGTSYFSVSPDQAQLLAMLVKIHGAEKCVEVGVYTISFSHLSNLQLLACLLVYKVKNVRRLFHYKPIVTENMQIKK
ncbi:uncharacterized protein LOC126803462 [Argentina anserina]|uniref:uncharacterized protein LOC126803462 n=1 Tax=Argentina anserina TaxID=57926 RepID=UPI0021767542|nr:uncharacterized protein LOC126803462 [Potentilla anserina]